MSANPDQREEPLAEPHFTQSIFERLGTLMEPERVRAELNALPAA